MAVNEKYSHKDFTHKILTDTKPEEWNDTEVVNSCFYNEQPLTKVFPDDIKGVTFIRCNLDNIVIPETCTIEGGTNKLIQVQKDGEDWILDKDLHPVEPLNKARYVKLGLSVDPAAISVDAKEVSVTQEKRQQLEDALQASIKALEDAAKAWR
jgi:hypothetical protein